MGGRYLESVVGSASLHLMHGWGMENKTWTEDNLSIWFIYKQEPLMSVWNGTMGALEEILDFGSKLWKINEKPI